MTTLGYPTEVIKFFMAMLRDRKTMLSFDSFTSLDISIDNSISQRDSTSMILYLIYSHGLINILQGLYEDGGAYINDTFFMAITNTFEECDDKLDDMLYKQKA